ncbi:putative prohibitin [Babesia divergens]|uniref:Prohibitin n=1 Tax=Babesia divergens TaxID=32595 RepID=A0AAD9GFV0_BABDI|nr:putative prohibitin [Babesia divergens]
MASDLHRIIKGVAGAGSVMFVVGGGSLVAYNSLYNVEAGHRALVYNRLSGVSDTLFGEGTHFIIPWFQRPIIYDTSKWSILPAVFSPDLTSAAFGRFTGTLHQRHDGIIFRTLGRDYDEKILPSIINEVLKSVVAHYNASQLLTQREVVSKSVRDQLIQRARDFNILLDDVSLTHVSFSPEYEKAVEAKQVAQQQAERSKYIVLKAKEEKKSTIIKAQGESEAAKLIGSAIRDNPAFVTLRRIETAKDIAEILSKAQNKIMLNSESLLITPEK